MNRISNKGLWVALAAVVVLGACDSETLVKAPDIVDQIFKATMSPANEVPPVTGFNSSGTSNVTVMDTNTIRVETLVSGIDSVTQAHIHAGSASVAGGIMVWLQGPFSGTQLVARGLNNNAIGLTGTLHHVLVTRSTATCATPAAAICIVKPFTFDSVLFRVRNGTAYVNVHTRKNPGGEIRGQILP
jgi:hypothetical protein